jgi:hypothetical protein
MQGHWDWLCAHGGHLFVVKYFTREDGVKHYITIVWTKNHLTAPHGAPSKYHLGLAGIHVSNEAMSATNMLLLRMKLLL